jgi:hypothetical protein
MEYATCGWFSGLGLKTIVWTVSRFGPQNPGKCSEEEWGGTWQNHRSCVKAKQICAGSMAIRSTEKELDHNAPVVSWFAPKYPGANRESVIALNKRGGLPQAFLPLPF